MIYLFLLHGVLVGQVTLREEGGAFVYRSEYLSARPPRAGLVSVFKTPLGAVPEEEAHWLWRRPKLGCVDGRDARTGKTGKLCVGRVVEDRVEGTVLGEPFQARYDAQGFLTRLELSDSGAEFERSDTGRGRGEAAGRKAQVDLFAAGFEVIGGGRGALALEPSPGASSRLCSGGTGCSGPPEPPMPWRRAAAEALALSLRKTLKADRGEASCLDVSLEFVREAKAKGAEARLVRGLVVDGGRAYPHAWVELRDEHGAPYALDPTLAIPVSPESHLALDDGDGLLGGADYLRLISGRARVVRRASPPAR
jgi:hypothetical protein